MELKTRVSRQTLPLLFEDAQSGPSRGPQRSTRSGLALVVLIFLATRLVTLVGAYYGSHMLLRIEHQMRPTFAKHVRAWKDLEAGKTQSPEQAQRAAAELKAAHELLDGFAPLCHFDANHYQSIVERGYEYHSSPQDSLETRGGYNIAWFPLYPLLCWPLAQVMSTRAALVLVANVAALAAVFLLYLWIRRRIDEPVALCSVALLLCLPWAAFFSFGYAESLTLLLVVAALYLMDRRSWLAAAVVSGLATATRPTALAIAAVLVLAFWFNAQGPHGRLTPRARLRRLIPLTLLSLSGIAAYAAYLTIRFGTPLVYVSNFRYWVQDNRRADWLSFLTFSRVWEQLKYFGGLFLPYPHGPVLAANPLMWNVPVILFILFVSLAGMNRVPRSFRPLLMLGPLIFLHAYLACGGAIFGIEPIGRYLAVAVPTFVVLAAWCIREWSWGARTALIAFFLLVQAALAFRYSTNEWCG
jgi:Gpi18-like mannosyltransferase